MKKSITVLSALGAVTAIISACIGVFYSFGGEQRIVRNIYGQTVTLFGDGIYANDSIMKVGATKGTDIAIIILSLLLIITLVFRTWKCSRFLQTGLLSIILYATACLVMGVSFNKLFMLYVMQFGCTLFAFILSLSNLIKADTFVETLYQRKLKGTAIFMLIGGCSVLVWMTFIVPAVISGQPMEIIDVYTTEPTFVFDLAIILPSFIFTGIMLFKQKIIGYKLTPILLTLLSSIGLCVILQNVVQSAMGIALPIGQVIGLIFSFVILGTIAIILNIRILRYAK